MLSASPVNSPDHRPCVLIAALSGRALAELACKAGYRPLVADLFGDMDTRRYAEAVRVLRGNLMQGPEPDDLIGALSDLAQSAEEPPIGLVCGAGFEQRPEILDDLASRWPLLGCSADVVKRAKDPASLARLCAELDIPHPAIRFDAPAEPEGWVAKSIGGSGGWHICDANLHAPKAGVYFQKRVPGKPVCALVGNTGDKAAIIGWSSQWTHPTPDVPYRWAGAVQPASMAPALQALLARKAIELAVAAGIVGIASLDFLIHGSTWHLLEINPRPGGTLDIFDDGGGRLFEMHIQACRGRLIEPPHHRGAQAAMIAFADRDIESMPDLRWPNWCADLQASGTRVEAGAPVCTIRAAAADSATARRLVEQRRHALLQMVHEPDLALC
jgi:predicted ATP-grasp superfamily ATP-dependent carboligase